MKMMLKMYVIVIFIISLLHRISGSTPCLGSLPYESCSLNIGCGCLPLSKTHNSSICAFLYVTCSELASCALNNEICYQPGYVCVKHPRCQSRPLCYPMRMATESICPSIPSITTTVSPISDDGICADARWKSDGITMAGGNGPGSALNQLHFPSGIFLDNDSNLYIADGFNHRIVKWTHGSSSGQIIAGDNVGGNRSDQFLYPTSLTIDKNGTMFVCEGGNKRIQRWYKNANQGETIISNIHCWGLFIDDQNSLYYSNSDEQSILRWPENEVVAGGNGEGHELNQLAYPFYFFIDKNKSVYVPEGENPRVVKWVAGAKQGAIVAGGNGNGHELNQLHQPMSVVVDHSEAIYIADYHNDRIMRWLKDSKTGIVIAGGRGKGNRTDQLEEPSQVLLDNQGNLWVIDDFNHRIQMFTIDKSSCNKNNF